MRKEILEKISAYRAVNDIALRNEIVVFGSTFMANFPFYELSQKYLLSSAVYNRSVDDITLAEAEDCLHECVTELKPSRIFLALGEKDLTNPYAFTIYKRILVTLRSQLPKAKIFILPILSESAVPDAATSAFNEKLREFAAKEECVYVPIPTEADGHASYEKIFKKLNCFFRDKHRLTFAEAFS